MDTTDRETLRNQLEQAIADRLGTSVHDVSLDFRGVEGYTLAASYPIHGVVHRFRLESGGPEGLLGLTRLMGLNPDGTW